jgi:hypothetical protein
MRIQIQLFTSMRIRIRDPGSQTNADPCGSGSDKKVDFDMKNTLCFMYVKCHKTYLCHVGKKAILKGWKSGLFVNFGQFSLLLDPDQHSQYLSGYRSRRAKSMRIHAQSGSAWRIRIRNTASLSTGSDMVQIESGNSKESQFPQPQRSLGHVDF